MKNTNDSFDYNLLLTLIGVGCIALILDQSRIERISSALDKISRALLIAAFISD